MLDRPKSATALPLADLKSDQCRWPVDAVGRCACSPRGPHGPASETRFCGAPAKAGFAYCEDHAARAVGQGTHAERNAASATLYITRRETIPAEGRGEARSRVSTSKE
ncbi:hypothetical protein [Hoeflea sp.]|uniref:hypothetical protein n=1 Tax=Hoeflea sp. TaxID=1940281 RepID=UPI003B52B451